MVKQWLRRTSEYSTRFFHLRYYNYYVQYVWIGQGEVYFTNAQVYSSKLRCPGFPVAAKKQERPCALLPAALSGAENVREE